MVIPTKPEELTSAWLTDVLSKTSDITLPIRSVDTSSIGQGRSFFGNIVRLRLEKTNRLESLIVKFKTNACEIQFYQQLADKVTLQVPRCYYSAIDPETQKSILLLEDLARYRLGDQLTGCSREEAELLTRRLAQFHAAWWESPKLPQLNWIPTRGEIKPFRQEWFIQQWESFLIKFGQRLDRKVNQVGNTLIRDMISIRQRLSQSPQTLLHGDYRLDNLFFDNQNPIR